MAEPIKTFDDVRALSDWYENEVFRAVGAETLFVYHTREHCWYRYRWSRGRREVKFVDRYEGALPLVTQIYPPLS